jgi:ABC-type uncharacterized transport system involved in gliding motility auxiliary subunit
MKTLKRLKPLKYLFWLGLFLTVMGLTAGVVSGTWGAIPLGLAIGGLVIIGLWLIFLGRIEDSFQPKFWSRRSTQSGTNALVGTIAVLAILGLINFLAVRHSTRIDLTESKLFTLAPESQQVLKDLKQGVKVYVFDNQQNPQDRDLLENYQRKSPQFSFAYVDPEANPGLAEQFGIKNAGENRDVYLEFQPSKRRQFLQNVNSQLRLSESKLTSGIVQITSDRRTQIYFLQGHGERSLSGEGGISQGVKALQDKNFFSAPLNLVQAGKVPADATVVVVTGPTRSLLDAEVSALEDYLNGGGNLMVMVDPKTKSGLERLLSQWGVKLDDRIAINGSDRQVKGWGATGMIVDQYGTHPITQDFRNGISLYPLARPLEITTVSGIQSTPLLLTDPKSWAESDLKEQPPKLNGGDRPGPLALGAAFTRTIASSTASPRPTQARLVVLGNSSFVNDSLFVQQLNGDVFLNSVRWLSQQDEQPLSIRPKDVKNRRIVLTVEQASVLAFIALVAVPLLGLGSAGLIWWRRR